MNNSSLQDMSSTTTVANAAIKAGNQTETVASAAGNTGVRVVAGSKGLGLGRLKEKNNTKKTKQVAVIDLKKIAPAPEVKFFLDQSGSMETAKQMMKLFVLTLLAALKSLFERYDEKTFTIIPFGGKGEYKEFLATENYNVVTPWTTTDTLFIQKFFEKLATQPKETIKPFAIVFLGDGDFDTNSLSVGKKFTEIIQTAAEKGLLEMCTGLHIFFRFQTSVNTIINLTNQLATILKKSANGLRTTFHTFGSYSSISDDEKKIINSICQPVYESDPGYLRIGDVGIWEHAEASELEKALLQLPIEKLRSIANIVLDTAKIDAKMLTEHQLYSLLYGILRKPTVFGEEMVQAINSIQNDPKTSKVNKDEISKLLAESKRELAAHKERERYEMLDAVTIGTVQLRVPLETVQEISSSVIKNDLASFLHHCKTFAEMTNSKIDTSLSKGFPILAPGLVEKAIANQPADKKFLMTAQSYAQFACSLLFVQFGVVLDGLYLYCAILTMLLTDCELNTMIVAQLQKAVFDDLPATLRFVGMAWNENDSVWDWDEKKRNLVSSPIVCKLLVNALTTYGNRIFPGVDFKERKPEYNHVYRIYDFVFGAFRMYNACTAIKEISSRTFTYTAEKLMMFKKTKIESGDDIPVGTICTLIPNKNPKNPQNGIPDLLVVRSKTPEAIEESCQRFAKRLMDAKKSDAEIEMKVSELRKSLQNKAIVFLEWFDHPFDTKDTAFVLYKDLTLVYNLSSLDAEMRDCICLKLNKWMCKMQQDGKAGLLGDGMKMGAAFDPELYQRNMEKSIKMIGEFIIDCGLEPEDYQIGGYRNDDVACQVQRSQIVDVVADIGHWSYETSSFLRTGNNPKIENLENAATSDPMATSLIPKNLPTSVVLEIREMFAQKMEMPTPSVGLKSNPNHTCCGCLEPKPPRNLEIRLLCGHDVCTECWERGFNITPTPGEPVDIGRCLCPLCREVLPLKDVNLVDMLNTPHTDQETLMCCWNPECSTPYYWMLVACGGKVGMLDKWCAKHRPERVCKCPNCEEMLESAGGCDYHRCPCGQAFCFGCGIALPWIDGDAGWWCQGQAGCNQNVGDRSTQPRGSNESV